MKAWKLHLFCFICILLATVCGIYFRWNYLLISLCIILCALFPIVLHFIQKKEAARELVIIAVMSAIAVAGRAALFMLPQIKPICAIVILAGIGFGRETGFLVGALSAFLSNFLFLQGIHTPFQMLAQGIIGFIAGMLFTRKASGQHTAVWAAVYTFSSVLVLYGGIVDLSTVLLLSEAIRLGTVLAVYLSALPFNLLHAGTSAVMLFILYQPFMRIVRRLRVKYGM